MNSRRRFLAGFGALAPLCVFALPPGDGANAYSDQKAADAWMTAWMRGFHAVSGSLKLGRFADPMYFLLGEITWKPNPGQTPSAVTVPKGFVTDLASVPRVFWSLLRPDGRYCYAAIIHDYLYWVGREREEADLILKYAMEDFHVKPAEMEAIYAAVRLGGGSAWAEDKRLRGAGERRILVRTPPEEEPTVTWEQWKRDASVFKEEIAGR